MKVGKTLVVVLVIVALAFFFIKVREDNNKQAVGGESPGIVEQKPSGDGKKADAEIGEGEEKNKENDVSVASKELKGEALYIGQIDANSIEVKEGETYGAYRLSPEIKESFDKLNLEENDRIEFTYYIDENGQKVITGIQKKP